MIFLTYQKMRWKSKKKGTSSWARVNLQKKYSDLSSYPRNKDRISWLWEEVPNLCQTVVLNSCCRVVCIQLLPSKRASFHPHTPAPHTHPPFDPLLSTNRVAGLCGRLAPRAVRLLCRLLQPQPPPSPPPVRDHRPTRQQPMGDQNK